MNRTKSRSHGPEARTDRPLICFLVFLVSNSLLAYSSLGFQAKIWIGLMGILLPFLLALWSFRTGPILRGRSLEEAFLVPGWAWVLALAGGVFLRLHGLTSLTVWPMWDDASCSFHGIRLMKDWDWAATYEAQGVHLLPLFFWLQGLWFKMMTPSLFSLWLFPALLSLGALVLGVWTARRAFPGPLAFLITLILSLGFWPVLVGKFAIPACLALFWEMGALACFVHYWKALEKGRGTGAALGLGAWLGAGFFISSKALPVIFLLGLASLWVWSRVRAKAPGVPWLLASAFFLMAAPEIPAIFQDLSEGHAHDTLVFSGPLDLWGQWKVSLSYLTVFFWGVIEAPYFHFGPLWGGYFNPILGAFILWGGVELVRRTKRSLLIAGLAGGMLFLAPGIFSRTYEMFRVLPLLPFLSVLGALGCLRLLSVSPRKWRGWALALLFTGSLVLDVHHLWGPFHQWCLPDKYSSGSKSPERYQAFRILEKVEAEMGPGLVLWDFYYDAFDQSLLIGTYPFNAAANPELDKGKVGWAGILVEPGDEAVLRALFKDVQYHYVSQGLEPNDGGMGLVVIGITDRDRGTLVRWTKVHEALQGLYPGTPFHSVDQDYTKVIEKLWGIFHSLPGDPYLQACLLRRIVHLSLWTRNLSAAVPLLEVPREKFMAGKVFLEKHSAVFHRLGKAFAAKGLEGQARRCFHRAASFDPAYPLSRVLAELAVPAGMSKDPTP